MVKRLILITFLICALISTILFFSFKRPKVISGAPPYAVTENEPNENEIGDVVQSWIRPDGPPRVGLQVGHWYSDDVPEELKKLRGNIGASGGGKIEWEINYQIAVLTKALLEKHNIIVDIIPATVPEKYWADAFIAIHADGNEDTTKTGYKASGPWRDITGNADELVSFVEEAYEKSTGFVKDNTITRNMRGYYAFGWWRYKHSVHPMTTSIILETGYLTNPSDREIIVDNPQLSAQGLAEGIIDYLKAENILRE